MKRFMGLKPNQLEVFEQIFIGKDHGHHPATLALLLRRELIIRLPDRPVGRDVFGVISIPVYDIPLPVHMDYCQWCADNFDGFEELSTTATTTPDVKDGENQ